MWKLRNKVDVEKERKRKYFSVKRPLFIAIFVFSISISSGKIGYEKFGGNISVDPVSWDVFFKILIPASLIIAVAFFFATFLYQLILKKRILDPNIGLICNKCYQTKNWDKKHTCQCGGKYIKMDEMEWVND